jgi:4a-hydroxytetrahydrobiopterin dehydratase
MAKLTLDQINDQLKALPGWEYRDNAIRKLYRFKQFMDGIRFIDRVAEIAEAADHHPDIYVNYTRVTFMCTTHSEGGVSEKDFKLAQEIEREFTARAG